MHWLGLFMAAEESVFLFFPAFSRLRVPNNHFSGRDLSLTPPLVPVHVIVRVVEEGAERSWILLPCSYTGKRDAKQQATNMEPQHPQAALLGANFMLYSCGWLEDVP